MKGFLVLAWPLLILPYTEHSLTPYMHQIWHMTAKNTLANLHLSEFYLISYQHGPILSYSTRQTLILRKVNPEHCNQTPTPGTDAYQLGLPNNLDTENGLKRKA